MATEVNNTLPVETVPVSTASNPITPSTPTVLDRLRANGQDFHIPPAQDHSLRERRFVAPMLDSDMRDYLLNRMSEDRMLEFHRAILTSENIDVDTTTQKLEELKGKAKCLDTAQFWLKITMIVMTLASTILFIFTWYIGIPFAVLGVGCWIGGIVCDHKVATYREESKKVEVTHQQRINEVTSRFREELFTRYVMQEAQNLPANIVERRVIQDIDYHPGVEENAKNSHLRLRALDLEISPLSYSRFTNNNLQLPTRWIANNEQRAALHARVREFHQPQADQPEE